MMVMEEQNSVGAAITATILFSGGKAGQSAGASIRLSALSVPVFESINITYFRSQDF